MITPQVIGAAILAGIGFTVSIFVANLSFAGQVLAEAKIGVLGASVAAGILGAGWLAAIGRRGTRAAPDLEASESVGA